jgi:ectoine hydroxylase-related dioxygenase (phytanoyl-CoA dioxygenase family)
MSLTHHGYQIHRGIFGDEETDFLRREADRIASQAGSACVRHLNDLSATFRELSVSNKISALLGDAKLQPVRSILFDKTPTENWPVAWHQDLTICTKAQADCEGYGPWSVKDGVHHVQPPISLLEQMVTLRIHLDPADSDNGALRVTPGSHRHGRLSSSSIAELTASEAHTCECQPGDVLLMSPLILHSSKRSTRPDHRRILHFEYAPPDALDSNLSWHESSAREATSRPRFP